MRRLWVILTLMLLMALSLLGCQQKTTTEHDLTIGVSIVPQETFVKAVAGDLVQVVTMIPPGASPTNYQPTPKQMTKLSEASILATDVAHPIINSYSGTYINTEINCTATEAFIAEMADYLKSYEFENYGKSTLVSYANELFYHQAEHRSEKGRSYVHQKGKSAGRQFFLATPSPHAGRSEIYSKRYRQ